LCTKIGIDKLNKALLGVKNIG